jgi:uncharacterized protein
VDKIFSSMNNGLVKENIKIKDIKFLIPLLGVFLLVLAVSLSGSYATTATNGTNHAVSSSHYNITIFDPTVGGNVLSNPSINKYIPKTSFSKQIFQMTKHGSVIIKMGNGKGPKLLISVGIHGNEPQANIAIMKYLELIKNKQINGTFYVIPFDIPRDTALNTRYYKGLDPNRIANIKNTPSWKIVQFARTHGIQYILDVHSGGGVGNNGYIYVNKYSTNVEKKWVSYIKSKTHSTSGVDSADSAGMIRIAAHNYGINTITLETERDSTPVMTAAQVEYKMILAATHYLGFS